MKYWSILIVFSCVSGL